MVSTSLDEVNSVSPNSHPLPEMCAPWKVEAQTLAGCLLPYLHEVSRVARLHTHYEHGLEGQG